MDPDESEAIVADDEGKYSVFDIANWFLKKGEMTHKKLQKLCYYAQAWCFALKGYRLENTDFQAWIHGPVSPALWERFKTFGYNPIRIRGNFSVRISPEDEALLEDVWDTYGENTGNALEALSHRELPWIEARRGYEPDERCSVTISPVTMASYYNSIYCGE
ncbi:MAG: DUF4065 domain-containing protein [Lachnospiraceae bacterium]|nr:DUF4065 domain-containing protein [Lachnospiraceae bacterium]